MKKKSAARKSKGFLHWLPRILAIAFILFLSIFALDVFDGRSGFWMTLAAFLIHLIPSLVLFAITVVAWHNEKVGGILFLILGLVFTFFFETYKEISIFLAISGPVFLTGILFLVNYPKKH
jgi:hypothetical protein